MSKINTGGGNTSGNLPKVSKGDRISYKTINDLSTAIQVNALKTSVGGVIKRSSGGTSVVPNESVFDAPPFSVWMSEEKTVAVAMGNIHSGTNKMQALSKIIYCSTKLDVPLPEIVIDISGYQETEVAPWIVSFPAISGEAILFIDASAEVPSLKYEYLENVTGKITDDEVYFIPIAYTNDGKIVQLQAGDIYLGDVARNKHPFKVTVDRQMSAQVKIEQGFVYGYGKNEFLDVGTDDYPNAVPVEGQKGKYLLNKEKLKFPAKDGDSVYLKFERTITKNELPFDPENPDPDAWGDDNTWVEDNKDGKWKVSIGVGAMGENLIYGNYNIINQSPCGWKYHQCQKATIDDFYIEVGGLDLGILDDLFPDAPMIPPDKINLQTATTEYAGKMFSYGTIYYQIASIKTKTKKDPKTGKDVVGIEPVQFLRSDFFFYPPLDNQYGFKHTKVVSLTVNGNTFLKPTTGLPPNEGECTPLETGAGLTPEYP